MSVAPNFRLYVRGEGDEKSVPTTLREFLEDNEGCESCCQQAKALKPGEEITVGNFSVRRPIVTPPRYTRVRVPIDLKEFRGSETATVTLDRKRLTMSIRPLRRRTVVELPLTELAEKYLAKQVKLDVLAKRKARRARR